MQREVWRWTREMRWMASGGQGRYRVAEFQGELPRSWLEGQALWGAAPGVDRAGETGGKIRVRG